MPKFDFIQALKDDGVTDCPRMGGMEDDRFYYRFTSSGDVHLGIKKHFDRWANSIDFVFSPPKTQNGYQKLKDRINAAMKAGNYDPGGGQELRL